MWVYCRGASDRSLSKAKGHSILFEIGRVDHLAHFSVSATRNLPMNLWPDDCTPWARSRFR
jgi:hypothetical protein